MSNYKRETKDPRDGKWYTADWLDDYFGSHRYGVRFPDGHVIDVEEVKLESRDNQTPQENREAELRKEWRFHGIYNAGIETFPNGEPDYDKSADNIADFFLSKRKKELEGIKREIEGMKIKSGTIMKVDELNTAEHNQGLFNGYNQALDDVSSLLDNHISNK